MYATSDPPVRYIWESVTVSVSFFFFFFLLSRLETFGLPDVSDSSNGAILWGVHHFCLAKFFPASVILHLCFHRFFRDASFDSSLIVALNLSNDTILGGMHPRINESLSNSSDTTKGRKLYRNVAPIALNIPALHCGFGPRPAPFICTEIRPDAVIKFADKGTTPGREPRFSYL